MGGGGIKDRSVGVYILSLYILALSFRYSNIEPCNI